MKCYKIDFENQNNSRTAYVVAGDAKTAIIKAETYIENKYNSFWKLVGLTLVGEGFE